MPTERLANTQTALAERVRNMLACLFGPRIKVRPFPQLPADLREIYLAGYVNSSDEEVAYLICDTQFAIASGAALTLIPPATAAEFVTRGVLSDTVLDNFKEVLNVCVGFYTETTNERMRLSRVDRIPGTAGHPLPAHVSPIFTCEVSIEQYPRGVIQFFGNQSLSYS